MQPHNKFRASMAASNFAGGPLHSGSLVFYRLIPREVKGIGNVSENLF